jgi:hypothetical protein
MATYSLGVVTPAAAAGAAYASIHTASTDRAKVLELGAFCNAATASSIGIIRSSNTPVATTSALGQAEDPNDPAATVNIDTAWSTAPTIGSNFLRRFVSAASIGSGVIWTWPKDAPLIIQVSTWLVVWNYGAGAGSALSLYVKYDE